MARRINIAEILERKKRLRRLPRWKQTLQRLRPLISTFIYIEQRRSIESKYRDEIMRHFPVAMVGCIEGYFRLLVRDLVNAGDPFRERCADLEKIEFGFDSLLAIADRGLTLGDIVSHSRSFNNLKDIQKTMSKLLDCDFLYEVKNWEVKMGNGNSTIVLDKLQPQVVPLLKKLFQLRHVYCHELTVKQAVAIREVPDITYAGFLFMIATEDYIQGVHQPKN